MTEEWRGPVYRQVYCRLWSDPDFGALDDGERSVFFYLLTSEQTNSCGLYRFSPAMAAEDLRTLPDTFAERFRKVRKTFGWEYDERHRVLWIRSWWKYNPPANSNVLKACLKQLNEVPTSPLDFKFFNNLRHLNETLGQTLQETLAERYGERFAERYPEPSPKQEQEQEQEHYQEQEKPLARSDDSPRAANVEQASPTVLTIPLVDGTHYPITEAQLTDWQQDFPGIQVEQEVRKCRQWNIANKKNRKTPAGILRHITAWLSKAQDRAPAGTTNGTGRQDSKPSVADRAAEKAERRLRELREQIGGPP